jgi:hypothetical protein
MTDATSLAIAAVKAQALWDAAITLEETIADAPAMSAASCVGILREQAAELHPEFRRLRDQRAAQSLAALREPAPLPGGVMTDADLVTRGTTAAHIADRCAADCGHDDTDPSCTAPHHDAANWSEA